MFNSILHFSLHRVYTDATLHVNIEDKYSKTSLNRPTIALTFHGPFREVVGLRS